MSFSLILFTRNYNSVWILGGNQNLLVLPYIEQEALYASLAIPYKAGATGDAGQQNIYYRTSGHNRKISTFLCPSDGNSQINVTSGTSMNNTIISYRASRADMVAPDVPNNSDMGAVNPSTQLIMRRSWLRAGQFVGGFEIITDGTSNSIMFSEGIIHDGTGGSPGGNYKSNLATGVKAHYDQVPQDCLNLKGAGGNYAGATQAKLNDVGHNLGRRALYVYPHCTYFHTLLPPNSPSCHEDWNKVLISASSNHSGGVNASMLDASVRFITDTISTANLSRSVTTQSPDVPPANPYDSTGTFSYGLWSELGSINGGESASLP
jgi:hypothetical protein